MENFYTAYTKVIDNKTHYFVKKFIVFPDLKDVPPMQESFGMHTDFKKACAIASLNDPAIMEQLMNELINAAPQAKVIDLNVNNYSGKSASL